METSSTKLSIKAISSCLVFSSLIVASLLNFVRTNGISSEPFFGILALIISIVRRNDSLSRFGPRWRSHHNDIDIGNNGRTGDVIKVPAAERIVVRSYFFENYGNTVIL